MSDKEKERKFQILMIDDNLSFLKSIQLALNRIGYQCEIAQNVKMAEEFLNSSEFDLVICDYFMPECDGKSALDSLGKLGKKGKMVLTSSYPLDIELKKTDNFTFVDKLSLLDWIAENHAVFQYI